MLTPGVTLPPLCWEGGGGFPFGAGCSSGLCPPPVISSTGWWLLGRPILGCDCVCSLGDKARAAPVSFSLLHPAWLVLLVVPVGFSQPLQAVWPLQQNLESSFPWSVPAEAGVFESPALGLHAGDTVAGSAVAPKGCPPDIPALMPVATKPAFALLCLSSPRQCILHTGLLVEKGVMGGMRARVMGSSGSFGAGCAESLCPQWGLGQFNWGQRLQHPAQQLSGGKSPSIPNGLQSSCTCF